MEFIALEAIILVGGLGTRLKSVVPDRPKPLADIGGAPFLYYLMTSLGRAGVRSVVLAAGYKFDLFNDFRDIELGVENVEISVEESPLGTGGAIKKAFNLVQGSHALVLNGDSFFDVNYNEFCRFHKSLGNEISIACLKIADVSRYGSIIYNRNVITGFSEKGKKGSGYINGGIYLVNRSALGCMEEGQFSFESFLSIHAPDGNFGIYKHDGYFIDIGIPEDYQRANKEIPSMIPFF